MKTETPTMNDQLPDANTGLFGFADELPADLFPFDPGPTEAEIDAMWVHEMERRNKEHRIANLVGIKTTELTAAEWAEVQNFMASGDLVIDLNSEVSQPEPLRHKRATIINVQLAI